MDKKEPEEHLLPFQNLAFQLDLDNLAACAVMARLQ